MYMSISSNDSTWTFFFLIRSHTAVLESTIGNFHRFRFYTLAEVLTEHSCILQTQLCACLGDVDRLPDEV
jgi:hypothetical protein